MPDDPRQILWLVILQDVSFAFLAIGLFWIGVFVARRFGSGAGYSLAPLGFSRPKRGLLSGVVLGLAVGFGALFMAAVVSALSALALEDLGYSSENTAQEPIMQGLQEWIGESPALAIPATVVVVVLFGPLVEELVFRGAIFGGLYRLGLFVLRRAGAKEVSLPAKWAVLVPAALFSSVFFALLHFSPVILLALFILSILLCILYERTGSLLPPFVAHATFNSFAILLIILSGLGVLPTPA